MNELYRMENYRDDYREDYRDNRDNRNNRDYRDDYRDYRDEYSRNQRDRYGRNRRSYRGYRNYRDEYVTMLEEVAEDGMELARAYEDVSEMATDGNEKQKLMKIAEREKEHYKLAKEMLEKHM